MTSITVSHETFMFLTSDWCAPSLWILGYALATIAGWTLYECTK